MVSLVVGVLMAVFGLVRYYHYGSTYKHVRREISGYDLNYLSPEREIKFVLYFLISKVTPFINGVIVFAVNLGVNSYGETAVEAFTVIMCLITLATELIFSYYLLPRVYFKYKGAGRNVKTIIIDEM